MPSGRRFAAHRLRRFGPALSRATSEVDQIAKTPKNWPVSAVQYIIAITGTVIAAALALYLWLRFSGKD